MADGFAQLDAWMAAMLARLRPAQRARISRKIGMLLRRNNAQRIAENVTPDGAPMEPRKKRSAQQRRADARSGRVRRKGRMFPKIRLARNMKVKGTADAAQVSFMPQVSHAAAVHHFGLFDRVARFRGAPKVRYPARPLLDISESDRLDVEEALLEALDQDLR